MSGFINVLYLTINPPKNVLELVFINEATSDTIHSLDFFQAVLSMQDICLDFFVHIQISKQTPDVNCLP